MKNYFIKIDKKKIEERTKYNLKQIESISLNLGNLKNDSKKEQRIKEGQCPLCFYFKKTQIVGHAFTEWNCGVCEQEFTHHNTGTPLVCEKCSKEQSICVKCGAKI